MLEDEVWSLFPQLSEKRVELLDEIYYQNLFKNKDIYVWGTGQSMKRLMEDIPYLEPIAFIDNNKKDSIIEVNGKNYEVLFLEEIFNKEIFIIIASLYYDEIKEQLKVNGYNEYLDFMHWSRLYPRPQELMKKILKSKKITNWKCDRAYTHIRLEADGSYWCCQCPGWTEFPIGNAFFESKKEIENSVIAKLFYYSIKSGKYCFCISERCVELKARINDFSIGNKNYKKPKVGVADIDKSCNLYCESCRKERYYSENRVTEFLKDYFIKECLPNVDIINCAGQGEVFLSKYYKEILDNCSANHKLLILSNGTLATKDKIEKISEKVKGNLLVAISVDAATEETYEKVRKGGNFRKLVDNLRDIGKLVKEKKVKALALTFVVSEKNYKEMSLFVELGKTVGATAVNFTKIYNWGTFTEEEYRKISLLEENNEPNLVLKKEMEKINREDIKVFIFDMYNCREFLYKQLEK